MRGACAGYDAQLAENRRRAVELAAHFVDVPDMHVLHHFTTPDSACAGGVAVVVAVRDGDHRSHDEIVYVVWSATGQAYVVSAADRRGDHVGHDPVALVRRAVR